MVMTFSYTQDKEEWIDPFSAVVVDRGNCNGLVSCIKDDFGYIVSNTFILPYACSPSLPVESSSLDF